MIATDVRDNPVWSLVRKPVYILASLPMQITFRRAALWIFALFIPSAYSVTVSEVGGALAATKTQQAQTPVSVEGDVTWDFETGDLRGWTSSGAAFAFQPIRGDNTQSRPPSSNHQGDYWIGTHGRHEDQPGGTASSIQGDRPQGTLESQEFEIPPGQLSLLVGGGSGFTTRVELVVISDVGVEERVLHATGNDSDAMQRLTWDLTPFAGRRGRIRIVDASSGDWGHVNVDDIRFASVTVPNVIGRDEATAHRVLETRGLMVGTSERVESRVAEGRVLVQNPRAGTRVEPGTPINLGVAELERVIVPNFVGRRGTEVDRVLASSELARGQVRTEESRRPEGSVVSQEPAANTRVPIETTVDLVVAVPVTVLVPNLVGRSSADAGRQLVDAELRRGRVRRDESRQPEGTVTAQSPAATERVAIDTAVDLIVATPVTVLVPDLVGQDAAAVDTLLTRDTELRPGRTTTEESREPEGTVLSHEPAASRRVAVDTEIDLVVATPVTILVPDLIGLDEAAVGTLLRNTELTGGTVEREESRRPVGTVLAQEPAAGTRVVINTPVTFTLASALTVVMPDVTRLTEVEALDLLDQYELGIGVVANRESPTDIGLVMEQWPTVGTRVDIGTGVDLVVAAVETVEVPSIVGLSVDAAHQVLATLRLVVGDETRQESRAEEEGTVLDQYPPVSTRVAIGSAVSLAVAEPEMVVVPGLIGLAIGDVDAVVPAAGLVVGIVEQRFSLREGGTVLTQSEPGGSFVEFGTALTVIVARDRILWIGPIVVLLLAGAIAIVSRRRRTRSDEVSVATNTEPKVTRELSVGVRPERDFDNQGFRGAARQPVTQVTVRLQPTIDPGTQQLEVEGDVSNLGHLISEERRQS